MYTNNTVKFTAGPNVSTINKIEITAESVAYATAAVGGTLTVNAGGGSATDSTSGSTATITMTGTVTDYPKPNAQTRWNNIKIYYEAGL